MPQDPQDADSTLESHLAERLKETRDVANFSRQRPPTAPLVDVAREMTIEGAEHLGGRKITDKFVRSSNAPAAPTPPPEEPVKPAGLEHHLKARLSEIQDTPITRASALEDTLERYRQNRRKLGGS